MRGLSPREGGGRSCPGAWPCGALGSDGQPPELRRSLTGLERQEPGERQAGRGRAREAGSACGVGAGQEIVLRASSCPQPSLGCDGQGPTPGGSGQGLKWLFEEPEVSRGPWQGREGRGTCLKKDMVAKCLGDPPGSEATRVTGTSPHGPGTGQDAGRVDRSRPGDLQCGRWGAAPPSGASCGDESVP